jgi:hypothetical protein
MEVHGKGELEAKLASSAALHGCSLDQLVADALTRYFEEEALRRGRKARRGSFPAR